MVESTGGGALGHLEDGAGDALVTGPGSEWRLGSTLEVGFTGLGTLTTADSGRVVTPYLPVGSNGIVLGDGILDTDVVSSGILVPGTEGAPRMGNDNTSGSSARVAAGTLTITGGWQQVFDGTLRIEAAGPTPGVDFGVLDVGTLAVLDGTVEIEFVDGYIPDLGTTFAFLTAGSIVGEFETVDAGGFEMNLDYGPNGVSAMVVAVSDVPDPGPGPGAGPAVPERTELLGAQPNPFSGTATIRWSAAAEQRTRISIVDAAGRLVRVLQNGSSGAGIHSVAWDGRSDRGDAVGSGVYFIRMEAETGSSSRRVVYLE